jgi:hypothetical protein
MKIVYLRLGSGGQRDIVSGNQQLCEIIRYTIIHSIDFVRFRYVVSDLRMEPYVNNHIGPRLARRLRSFKLLTFPLDTAADDHASTGQKDSLLW